MTICKHCASLTYDEIAKVCQTCGWRQPTPPAILRQAKPGELLFSFTRGTEQVRCELRDHGDYGVEAQFIHDGFPLTCRMFSAWRAEGFNTP